MREGLPSFAHDIPVSVALFHLKGPFPIDFLWGSLFKYRYPWVPLYFKLLNRSSVVSKCLSRKVMAKVRKKKGIE